MASKAEIDDRVLDRLNASLKLFFETTIQDQIKKGAERIGESLRKNIVIGKDIHGNFYAPVRKATLEMPIKFTGAYTDTRIRGDVSNNPTAFNVTGKALNSIYVVKGSGKNAYEVGYEGERQAVIFEGNARASGNTNKARRDPLGLTERNASDSEFDYVADAVEFALERALNGY
jgi:hypothetical protein